MERERKVNVDSLASEQIETAAETLGKRVNKILEDAKAEADKILGIYGLQLDLGYEIKSKGTE